MSGVKVIRALLLAHAPVADLAPAARIVAGVVPMATPLPAIGITEISRSELLTTSQAQRRVLVTERVQVTVHAKSYPEQKTLLQAARLAPGINRGVTAGVTVLCITRAAVGPDMSDEAASIFDQSRDFLVKYVEDN